MNDPKQIIAKELIEILAKKTCGLAGAGRNYANLSAEKMIIEAARMNYSLPEFCAEINTEAGKCINCIIDGNTPAVCRKEVAEAPKKELEIEWA